MNAIEFQNVNIHFQDRQIIKGLSFKIENTSITAIMGPSGAGKSTLLRAMNRLLEDEPGFNRTGKILFDDREIHAISPVSELRRRMGLVFQKPVVYPISILKNVLFGVHHLGLVPKSKYLETAEKYLKETFLWNEVKDRLKDSALKLSVGQQQRLAIARSLAVDPEVLLFDEPTSSLDGFATEKIEEMIKNQSLRKTVVLVTHDAKQASALARSVIHLPSQSG